MCVSRVCLLRKKKKIGKKARAPAAPVGQHPMCCCAKRDNRSVREHERGGLQRRCGGGGGVELEISRLLEHTGVQHATLCIRGIKTPSWFIFDPSIQRIRDFFKIFTLRIRVFYLEIGSPALKKSVLLDPTQRVFPSFKPTPHLLQIPNTFGASCYEYLENWLKPVIVLWYWRIYFSRTYYEILPRYEGYCEM